MNLRTSLLACGLLVLASVPAISQEAETPPSIAVGFWQCDIGAMDQVIEQNRERWLPIAQELVVEGAILGYGALRHHWGDEWNYVEWISAANRAAATDANDEIQRRYEERYDDGIFGEHCRAHRDNIYTIRLDTGTPPAMDPANPPSVAVSFWQCEFPDIGDILQREDSLVMPIVRELVAEGALRRVQYMTHDWGDEWTLVRSVSAADVPALIAALDEVDRRMAEQYPNMPTGPGTGPLASCRAHKDNIYTGLYTTTGQRSAARTPGSD